MASTATAPRPSAAGSPTVTPEARWFIYVDPQAHLVLVRHGSDCGAAGISPHFFGEVAAWVEGHLHESPDLARLDP